MNLPKPGELACDGCGALAYDAGFGCISWTCRYWCPYAIKIYGAKFCFGTLSLYRFKSYASAGAAPAS